DLFPNDPTYIITSDLYPVQVRYHDRDFDYHKEKNIPLLINATLKLTYDLHYSDLVGDILIFAVNKSQVETILKRLEDMNMTAEIHSVHDNLGQKELERVYLPSINRKIIVATDIAETTITLTNLVASSIWLLYLLYVTVGILILNKDNEKCKALKAKYRKGM
ncbi:unnamed protein product, partial [marine sediment metagenome]